MSLSFFIFTSIGISLPIYLFALTNLPISIYHTLPTIVAFFSSTPFYTGAVYALWSHTPHRSNHSIFRFTKLQRWCITFYLVVLELVWLLGAIMSAIGVLYIQSMGNSKREDVCGSHSAPTRNHTHTSAAALFNSVPSRRPCALLERQSMVTMTLSCVLSSIEAVLICAIIVMFNKRRTAKVPASAQSQSISIMTTPDIETKDMTYHRRPTSFFLTPLAFISLGFAIPPLTITSLNVFESFLSTNTNTSLLHYLTITFPSTLNSYTSGSILTILAFTLTLSLHMSSLYKSRSAKYNTSTYTSTHLLSLQILWFVSALCVVTTLATGNIWDYKCDFSSGVVEVGGGGSVSVSASAVNSSLNPGCKVYPPLSLVTGVVSCLMQVVILGLMGYIAAP